MRWPSSSSRDCARRAVRAAKPSAGLGIAHGFQGPPALRSPVRQTGWVQAAQFLETAPSRSLESWHLVVKHTALQPGGCGRYWLLGKLVRREHDNRRGLPPFCRVNWGQISRLCCNDCERRSSADRGWEGHDHPPQLAATVPS